MKKHYRIAVNKGTNYAHFEPCGEDISYAKKQFDKIKSKELTKNDSIALEETDFSTFKNGNTEWVKVSYSGK